VSPLKTQAQDLTRHLLFPYIELGCALLAGALWFGGRVSALWPLLLLALMWSLYWLRTGFSLRPALFDVLLGLFVLSALMGTQTAYAPAPAWGKFWLIVGAWGIYYALVHQPDSVHLYGALSVGGLLGVALAVCFFMVNPWDAVPIKVSVLTALGKAIATLLPTLTTQQVNPNVFGGLLAMILPFYAPLILLAHKETSLRLPNEGRRTLLPFLWLVAAGVVLLSLLVTTTRGAWLAVLVTGSLWGFWLKLERQFPPQVRLRWLMGLLLFGGVLTGGATYVILTYNLPGAGALTNRLTLFTNSLPLARDYVLTGAGLGTFQMNFSIYTLLIHVGYIINSHNLFVNLLVEQGALGLALYLGLVALCIGQGGRALHRASPQQSRIIEAGLASLGVLLLHGQVEDILYGSQWLPLLFVPFAIVRGGGMMVGETKSLHTPLTWRRTALAAGMVLILSIVFWRPLLAQSYASLGAMRQARLELARYEFGRTPGFIMDSVRQQEDLGEVIALFERAIAFNPANVTARQRLAGIQLSQGEYAAALRHLEIAWKSGSQDSVTRMLLGDALVAHGRVDEAAKILNDLPWAKVRLEGQAWSRYGERDDFARAAHAWRTIALLEPEYAEAALQRANEAEIRMMP